MKVIQILNLTPIHSHQYFIFSNQKPQFQIWMNITITIEHLIYLPRQY